jgi:acetyltransferase-like isoleucine patch superfamily enzyme
MNLNNIFLRLRKLNASKVFTILYRESQILKYRFLSNCGNVVGKPETNSGVLINGEGKVTFEGIVNLGVLQSPYFFNTYIYLESRTKGSSIYISDGVWINNNVCIVSEGPGVFIGKNVLIGQNCSIYDSDFHNLNPGLRKTGNPSMGRVSIQENVFIGANVTILKNVSIGANSVIAAGSIVTKNIPSNVIAGGNPCVILKNLE